MDLIFDTPLPANALAIDNTADVTRMGAALAGASTIALVFPKWTDGRAYSQARLLRSRVGFGGKLIATGEVLVDMLPLLQRCGFDAAALRDGQDLAAARRALGYFDGHSAHYQADLISKLPHYARSAGALQ